MLQMFVSLQNWIADRTANLEERGATATEYALLIALIAVVLAGTLTAFSGALKGVFTSATSALGSGAAASH